MWQLLDLFEPNSPALVILGNLNGHISTGLSDQKYGFDANKPAKDSLKRHLGDWYAHQVMLQFDEEDDELSNLEPVDLGLPMLKELGHKWLK